MPLGSVPKELQEHVRSLLSITGTVRPDVHMMSKVCETNNVSKEMMMLHKPANSVMVCSL